MQSPAEIPFNQLLDALLDAETPLNPRYLYRLSDLEKAELEQLEKVWPRVPAWRRLALMEDIEELNEADMLLSFESLSRFALRDEDPKVRVVALRTLWDYEETSLIPLFLEMLAADQNEQVRAAAASALGRFIYAGELEEIPEKTLRQIEDVLLKTVTGNDAPEVRRSALESLGFSSRAEVDGLIRNAFASEDKYWKASALLAMGRSANQEWQPQVLAMLESSLPLLRSEAARAAGELEISEALPFLFDLLDDPDDNTRQASIWSLSQIGGEGVRETLQQLYEEADNDLDAAFLESALDNLAFNEGVQMMPLFDLPEADSNDDWYEEYDDDWDNLIEDENDEEGDQAF